ncbi:MAG: hypothetical protein Q9188_000521 [Gyalolechia gomerana]
MSKIVVDLETKEGLSAGANHECIGAEIHKVSDGFPGFLDADPRNRVRYEMGGRPTNRQHAALCSRIQAPVADKHLASRDSATVVTLLNGRMGQIPAPATLSVGSGED